MLVLSRKAGESIIIGKDIVIRVMHLTSGYVSLGIEAPATVSIHRDEVLERIQREKNDNG